MASIVSIPIEKGAKTWIDISDPSSEILNDLTVQHNLHPAFVRACLDPSHLPKFEQADDTTFIIVRAYDEESTDSAETVQTLTRKIAIFITSKVVLSIHRSDQQFIQDLRKIWIADGKSRSHQHLINNLLAQVVGSYNPLINQVSESLDSLEESVFRKKHPGELLEVAYRLKRRTSMVERLLRMTQEIIPSPPTRNSESPFALQLNDKVQRSLFSLDDIEIRLDQLLQLHLAIESHKTNDVMRVLTMFSVFFLPLTFIVGIYGMNFKFMPELEWKWGDPFAISLMIGVVCALYLLFKRKGWLER